MWKSGLVAVLAAFALVPGWGQADPFTQSMNTMWEVLWHQSGTPTRLVRWEQPELRVRVSGANAAAHKEHTLQALRAVGAEAGLKMVDVSGRPDAAQAEVSVEIAADSSLSESQPCETRLNFRTEDRLQSVTLQMRESEARRCAYHEAMHVMGVRGHPEGATVLSYFAPEVEGLTPLDKVMLRAWYSPRARGGMTPFEVLPILADELVALMPDPARARVARDRFLAQTVQEMQSFAEGGGDVPAIVKRSGKASELGVRQGRMEMSYFLGVAYLQGSAVQQDTGQGMRWLQRAAALGSRTAQARLGAAGTAQGS